MLLTLLMAKNLKEKIVSDVVATNFFFFLFATSVILIQEIMTVTKLT